jgi:drug/metabolite transporter (DMT)-like permease
MKGDLTPKFVTRLWFLSVLCVGLIYWLVFGLAGADRNTEPYCYALIAGSAIAGLVSFNVHTPPHALTMIFSVIVSGTLLFPYVLLACFVMRQVRRNRLSGKHQH